MNTTRKIKVEAITCPKCYQQIWSRHRHDCRSCKCEYCYIDGGRDYTRVGFGNEWNEQDMYGEPLLEEIEVLVVIPMLARRDSWPY